jgi:PAS domain S-box-containing protein
MPLDIFECSRTVELCQQNECKLRAIFEATRDGIVLVNDEGRCTDANPAAEAIFGIPREEFSGRRLADFTGDIDFAWAWGTFLDRGEMRRECRIGRPDGDVRDTELTAVARILPDRHLFVFHDITERKHFQEERERLLAELETIIGAITDGVILYGSEGEILRMNPAAEAIFPYTAEEKRKPLRERWQVGERRLASGETFLLETLPAYRVLQGEEAQAETLSYLRSDGSTLWLIAGAAPVRTPDGRIWGAVGTYTDITRVQQLGEENEIFMHMIAHDLRTPLTVILGHAEMLQPVIEATVPGEIPRLNIEAIVSAGQQMAKMMEDLVDVARMQSGQLQLDRERIDLSGFVRRFLERSRVALDVTRVQVELPAPLPPVWADATALERVLTNLLANALKYAPPDTAVEIRVQSQDGHLVCAVTDHGPGIAAQELPHIFNRFYRARQAAKKAGGLGLGLSITKLLVEAQGGDIWVESTPGEGSTFFFSLPTA